MKTEKLELRHLAPYLPYGLKMIFQKSGREILLSGLFQNERGNMILMDYSVGEQFLHKHWNFKPILRPLSDLTKEIEVNGERFVPMEVLLGNANNLSNDHYYWKTLRHLIHGGWNGQLPKWVVEQLHKWHFDTENLIESGLAIDINSTDQ